MDRARAVFQKNLKKQLELSGESQAAVGRALGLSRSTINSYVLGHKLPNIEVIRKLATHFGCAVSDLVESDGTEYVGAVRIPILGKIPAGVPIEAVEDVIGYEEIPVAMASKGEFFALKVKGDSMYPLIYSGESIIIKKQESADNGDIVVALIDNEDTTVKRIKSIDGGIVLEAVNPEYQSLYFSEDQVRNGKLKILGKAVESRKQL